MQENVAQPSDPNTESWLRLCLVAGVGPRLLTALLTRFETPEAVLAAGESQLQEVEGVGPRLAQSIAAATQQVDPAAELKTCREANIHVLTRSSPEYPRMLLEIPDPPGVLFLQGTLCPADAVAIAVVGSRNATRYGLGQAERLAGGLARAGITVVAGLARGIDAAAHRGALAAGGRTLAVLGGDYSKCIRRNMSIWERRLASKAV